MTSNNVLHDYIAGAIGGAAGLIVGHPFDTTKVQMQTQQAHTPYKGTMDALKHINHSGLSRGFFRGLGFPLASYGLVNSIFFGVYGNTVKVFHGGEDRKPTYSEAFLAGCTGGLAQLLVACPVDVVKVVLQSQIPRNRAGVRMDYFRGPIHCFKTLLRAGGIQRCYKGLGIQASRDLPASGTYFFVYESSYDQLMQHGLSDKSGVVASFLAGGTAGVLSWMLILPLDVIKSQVQADYKGQIYSSSWHCVQAIYGKLGLRGFFTGIQVMFVRAFLTNAVTFVVYQQSLRLLKDHC